MAGQCALGGSAHWGMVCMWGRCTSGDVVHGIAHGGLAHGDEAHGGMMHIEKWCARGDVVWGMMHTGLLRCGGNGELGGNFTPAARVRFRY